MSLNSKMTALADEVRELSGTTTTKSISTMITDVENANEEINEQVGLITQIANALVGKAAGDGDIGTILPILVSPATSSDILSGKQAIDGSGNIIIGNIETVDQATPSVSIDSNGLITASTTQDAGYVSAGTKSGTKQLATQGAKTITPSNSSQTAVSSGMYTTGDITVEAIPSTYVQPSGTKSITENGTHDVKLYESVSVNVMSTGGGSNEDSETLINLINGSLTSLTDDRITTIAQYAFTYHPTLESVSLPSVTRTNTRAFDHASVLKSVSLPGLTGTTYTYLCSYCTALTNVDIKNAKTISNYTFYYCTALTKLDLHKATSIGTNVFNASSKFTTLIIRTDSVCTLGGTNSFTGTKIASGTGYIYVPSALIDSYKTATNWSTYANQFRAIEDYPDICG